MEEEPAARAWGGPPAAGDQSLSDLISCPYPLAAAMVNQICFYGSIDASSGSGKAHALAGISMTWTGVWQRRDDEGSESALTYLQ